MSLTDVAIRKALPREKSYKLYDEKGLFIEVPPKGSKRWRLRYRIYGKEKLLSVGTYPKVTLSKAREEAGKMRERLAQGIDPSLYRKQEKLSKAVTFEAVSKEWLEAQRDSIKANTYEKSEWLLGLLYPVIGSIPIGEIEAPDLLAALRPIEARGRIETAHRAKQKAGQVFRYAIATGRAVRDPSPDLKSALKSVKTSNHAAITKPEKMGELLRAIDGYQGTAETLYALQLAALVFVRPGELRHMEWSEIDTEAAEWRIPAGKMKMPSEHIVPLSSQVLQILGKLKAFTSRSRYVFPSVRSAERPMSENTLNAALRRLGYTKEEMTAHGFRAMASTRLNEMGWAPDVIELQLAHVERNKVRAAYNRAQRMEERRRMMQAWADYLDSLRAGGRIVAIKSAQRG